MTINTVKDATHELYTAAREMADDLGEDVDEGSVISDLFASMCMDWPTQVAAEVARFEIGWVPMDAPTAVMDMFDKMYPSDGMDW